MNTSTVKEEEISHHIPVPISRPLQNNMIRSVDMGICQSSPIQKFTKALYNLQMAQFRNQQEINPKYPFVLQYSPNELIVHLGQNTANLLYCQQLRYIQYQMQLSLYPPKVIHSHRSLIRLSIQKRREISIENQKDSKNIPKNYCKAIITFALKNQNLCLLILKDQSKVVKFFDRITQCKKSQMNIRTFSSLLTESDDPEEEEFNQAFRILSQIFVKKFAINYIFNSKIVQYNWHLKYRYQIYKGIKSPRTFSHIKNL